MSRNDGLAEPSLTGVRVAGRGRGLLHTHVPETGRVVELLAGRAGAITSVRRGCNALQYDPLQPRASTRRAERWTGNKETGGPGSQSWAVSAEITTLQGATPLLLCYPLFGGCGDFPVLPLLPTAFSTAGGSVAVYGHHGTSVRGARLPCPVALSA